MAVLAETLRLWPPSWMFSRRILEPVVLGGRTLQVGTMCLVSPALLHRDPRWWAEPERFRPDRWLRRLPGNFDHFDPKSPGQPRGAYLPFGAGPRMCMGGRICLVGGRDDAGCAWPLVAPPRPRRSVGHRPILNDVAAERSRAGDDVAAEVVTFLQGFRGATSQA